MSKIPKFKSKTTDEVPELPIINNQHIHNLRRSKSFSDLRATTTIIKKSPREVKKNFSKFPSNSLFTDKNNILRTANMKKNVNQVGHSSTIRNNQKPVVPTIVPSRSTVKRPAEKNEPEVKPKIVKKPPKVPEWDYKTRFGILNEKHTALRNDFKNAEQKLAESAELQQQKEILTQKVTEQDEKIANVLMKIASLEKSLKERVTEIQDLNLGNQKIVAELQNVSEENRRLKEELSGGEKIRQELQSTVQHLKASLEKSNNEHVTAIQDLSIRNQKITTELHNTTEENRRMKDELYAGEKVRRILHNTIQDLKGNIRVFCRVRPPLNDLEEINQCNFNFPSDTSIEMSKIKNCKSALGIAKNDIQEFSFDRVFDQRATQNNIFEELSQFIQSALDGYHVCVFAYGQTGSGKTYTMQGESETEKLGMIPRSIELIFEKKAEMEKKNWTFDIQASFLEIYNENIRDLLEINSEKHLDIRFNDGKGTTVSNLTIVSISTAEELMQYMLKAQKYRTSAVTDINEHSSRSHAVTKIYIEARFEEREDTLIGSVSLVDLAGSETANSTNTDRLVETKNINKSLSSLGNVMLALHKREMHIPYRNSKLTFLLQSSLGGNCKCLMIVNISPSQECYNESLNALRFAAKVKEVKTSSISRNKVIKTPCSALKQKN